MLQSSKDVGISEMLVGHLRVRKSEFRSMADVERSDRTMDRSADRIHRICPVFLLHEQKWGER